MPSSRIEGTRAGLREVLELDADPRDDPGPRFEDILEIIDHRSAMAAAVDELKHRPLSLNLIRRAHAQLLGSVRGRDKRRGEVRHAQLYIGTPGTPLERATYVPRRSSTFRRSRTNSGATSTRPIGMPWPRQPSSTPSSSSSIPSRTAMVGSAGC